LTAVKSVDKENETRNKNTFEKLSVYEVKIAKKTSPLNRTIFRFTKKSKLLRRLFVRSVGKLGVMLGVMNVAYLKPLAVIVRRIFSLLILPRAYFLYFVVNVGFLMLGIHFPMRKIMISLSLFLNSLKNYLIKFQDYTFFKQIQPTPIILISFGIARMFIYPIRLL